MRYITLTAVEARTRKEAVKNHSHARQRRRAQGLCLSHQGVKIDTIACIYSVDRDTVAGWFNRWERLGIIGLQDKVRSGRPAKLTPKEQARVGELFKAPPRAPKRIAAAIFEETGKRVSVDTLKRIGKKALLCWKRIRRKRDPKAFKQGKEELNALRAQHAQGEIELYFFDVSGASLTPYVP